MGALGGAVTKGFRGKHLWRRVDLLRCGDRVDGGGGGGIWCVSVFPCLSVCLLSCAAAFGYVFVIWHGSTWLGLCRARVLCLSRVLRISVLFRDDGFVSFFVLG